MENKQRKNEKIRTVRQSLFAILLAVLIGGCALGFGIGAGYAAVNNSNKQVASTANSSGVGSSDTHPSSDLSSAMPGGAVSASVADVFSGVESSVVSISVLVQQTNYFNQVQTGQSVGSGVVFKEDSSYIYIVTNYHVIDQAKKCTISFDDKTQVSANFVGGYPNSDIAVIKASKTDLSSARVTNYTVATFADSDNVKVGDTALSVGNAAGGGKSATFGIISAVGRQISDDGGQPLSFLQTDAAINPGNSGGALVSSDGQVIGINTMKLVSDGIEGMGYAVPSNTAISLINQIMSSGSSGNAKPMLGVLTIDITQVMKDQYSLPATGVYVYNITEGSTAAAIGIQPGDIITAYNGNPVTTGAQLTNDIAASQVGEKVTMTVIRLSKTSNSFQTLTLSGVLQQATSGTNF